MIDLNKQEFSRRLAALRINKGVSARDMSLSIGQSAGYINNIENGINLPSMQAFFYICEYLEITPKEFFDTDTVNPMMISGIIVWIKQKNPHLFLSAFLMFVFSALGPATGNSDLIFFISMFGELLMVLFLYYCSRRLSGQKT